MITVKADGIEAVMAKFKSYSVSAQIGIDAALEEWANNVARDAKLLVSANSSNEGMLLNSIHPDHGNGYASVTASAAHAAYVSSLPGDWAAYANTFKGKSGGGTFKDFVKILMAWGARTGKMDPKYAYVTALKILRDGVKARPFLYPSVNKNLPLLMQDIKAIFK